MVNTVSSGSRNQLWGGHKQKGIVWTSFTLIYQEFHIQVFFFFPALRQQGIKAQQKAKKTCLIEFSGCLHGRYKRLRGDINHRQSILLRGSEHTRERGCRQERLSDNINSTKWIRNVKLETSCSTLDCCSDFFPPKLPEIDPVPAIRQFHSENLQLCCTSWALCERKWAVGTLLCRVWKTAVKGKVCESYSIGELIIASHLTCWHFMFILSFSCCNSGPLRFRCSYFGLSVWNFTETWGTVALSLVTRGK